MTLPLNYCSTCGSELGRSRIENRMRWYCESCSQPVYRNSKPCAGVLVVKDEQLLLVKRTVPPAVGTWSLPAGYLEFDESPEEGACRELSEETGLSVSADKLELFDTNLVTNKDETHVLVIIYRVIWNDVSGSIVPGSDAASAQFWDIEALVDNDQLIEPGYESIFRRAALR